MEIPGIRMEIEDNTDAESHVGRTVGELREFLSNLPDDALIVWAGEARQNPLILVQSSDKTHLYMSESTHGHQRFPTGF